MVVVEGEPGPRAGPRFLVAEHGVLVSVDHRGLGLDRLDGPPGHPPQRGGAHGLGLGEQIGLDQGSLVVGHPGRELAIGSHDDVGMGRGDDAV
ncbi:MAG: hypothetical protein QM747_06095 [Nocardioides sp.]